MKPYMSFAVALVSIVFTSVAPCWVVSPNIGRVDLPDKGTVSSPGKGTDGAGRINMTNTSFPNGTAPNTPDDSVKSQGDEVLKDHSIGKTVPGEIKCSNADGTILYTRSIGSGGAPLKRETLSVEGTTEEKTNINQPDLKVKFSNEVVIPNAIKNPTISTAFISGVITIENNEVIEFSDFVICKQMFHAVACHGPNGQPCH